MNEAGARGPVIWARLLGGACLVVAAASASGQAASPATPVAGSWRGLLEAGDYRDVKTARIGIIYDWDAQWRLASSLLLFGYTEATLGRFQADHNARFQHAGFTQAGITPVLRLAGPSRTGPFGELGVGANLIAPVYKTIDTRFSSQFNFGDHLGIGWRLPGASAWELALRVEHFSNAGYKHPNPGQNIVELRASAAF